MDIRHYISSVEKTYCYRIKTIVPLTDDAMGRIERIILKYQPIDLSTPRKTMFQKNPLDFPTVPGAEVHIVDVELGLPASPYNLAREIKDVLGVPDKFVVVRGSNDPTELETERFNAVAEMDEKAAKEGMEPGALLDMPQYDEVAPHEASDYYGDTYNRKFLGYIAKVESERKEAVKKSQPFEWLPAAKSDVEADAGPTIGHEDGKPGADVSGKGNLDDARKSYSRVYRKDGKTFVKIEGGDPVRKA